jgi:hyperosmotically inducible periplasmic protein
MWTKNGKQFLATAAAISLIVFTNISLGSTPNGPNPAGSRNQPYSLADEVRHELVMLPLLGVFDSLAFSIEDPSTVVLSGQVLRPILKSDAELAVKRLTGVSKVVNNIEVLPLSPFDDAIRVRTYRAIYSTPGFEKYAIQAVSPIRIIVKNGNITLLGAIGSQMDKTMAEMAARSIPGVFSVTDNLTIS